jgi:hypothetical protein
LCAPRPRLARRLALGRPGAGPLGFPPPDLPPDFTSSPSSPADRQRFSSVKGSPGVQRDAS